MQLEESNLKAYFSLSGIRLISDLLCFDMGVNRNELNGADSGEMSFVMERMNNVLGQSIRGL